MTENEGVYKWLEYLDLLKDNINSFEIIVGATELMGEMPLSEEQIEAMNAILNGVQESWQENFLELLKLGVKWIEHQKGDIDD